MSYSNIKPEDLKAEIRKLTKARDEALNAARSALRDTTRVTRLLMALNERVPFNILLDNILSTVTELFSSDIAALIDTAGTGHFRPIAFVGIPEEYIPETISMPESLMMSKLISKGVIVTPEMIKGIAFLEKIYRKLKIETAVWIPLRGSEETRGALILARCKSLPFTDEEVNLLSAMAYRIALAIEQIQHKNQLEHIISKNRDIGSLLNEMTIREEAVKTFPLIIGADAGSFFCNIDNFGFFFDKEYCDFKNLPSDILSFARNLCDDPEILKGDVKCLINTEDSPFSVSFSGSTFLSMLAAPIFRESRLVCLLYAFRVNAVHFTEETRQVASLFAGQVSIALENAHHYKIAQDELRERKQAEKSLMESQDRFRALIHNISDIIAVLNADGSIKYISNSVIPQWGCEPKVLVGNTLLERVHQDDHKTAVELMRDVLKNPGKNISRIVRMQAGEAEAWRYFDVIQTNLLNDPSVEGIVSTFHDITERKMVELNLTELAFRDPLTGLANRAYFRDRVRFSLLHANKINTSVAVIFFDLDDFKYINDKYGHLTGDTTLCAIAERVRRYIRSNDIAARFGGDEFTILFENIHDIQQLQPMLDRLVENLFVPVKLSELILKVGGSIGIAISIPDQDDVDSLLRKADLAMYQAKRSGKGRYVIYEPALEG
ncbi:MAG: diguanylate cyclase [Spirochaetes bacterium]|nr:diguanylate cyclase [Spirochaetota bacterium]